MWPGTLFGRSLLVISLAFIITSYSFYRLYSSHMEEQLLHRQVVTDARYVNSLVELSRIFDSKREMQQSLSQNESGLYITDDPPHLPEPAIYNTQQSQYLDQLRNAIGREDIYMGFVSANTDQPNDLLLTIPMAGGQWLNTRMIINPINPDGLADLQMLSLVLSLLFLAVFYLAIYRLTRPLKLFLESAQKLGRDLHRQPLEEKGSAEIKLVARILNTMQYRLQLFVDDRARLLAAISHDLKTPLTRMQLRLEIADETEVNQKLHKDVSELKQMVENTLSYTRDLEHNEDLKQVNLRSLLQTLADDATDNGLSVSLEDCDELVVQARPLELKRAFNNLLENGINYGDEVSISLSVQGEYANVSFRDQGPGIPGNLLEAVFKPYYRLESSRSKKTGGTGLGLSIARNIAREHGGDLQLVNLPERGLEAQFSMLTA